MAQLFGFSITRAKKPTDPQQAFTTTQVDDGTQTIAAEVTLVNTLIWKVRLRVKRT